MAKIKIEKADQKKLDSLGVSRWSPWECDVSAFDTSTVPNRVLKGVDTSTAQYRP